MSGEAGFFIKQHLRTRSNIKTTCKISFIHDFTLTFFTIEQRSKEIGSGRLLGQVQQSIILVKQFKQVDLSCYVYILLHNVIGVAV